MKKISALIALFTAFFVTTSFASQCPTSNVISDPELFQWTHHQVSANNPEEYYSGVIEIGEATFTINGETLTTRAYRQEGGEYSIPGPTMVMAPGKKYVLQFKNLLPFEAASTSHNVFKDPNVSNIHTHGLHISGETPSDDVTRSFEGGFGGDFVYDIPSDHMGGSYWYHAHHHGSTFLQVSGGAFGLIIIDDSNDGIPSNVAAMAEKQLVLGYLDPGAAGTGGDILMSGSLGSTWTANGKVNGNTCLPPNTWQHWRVLLADRDAKPKTVSVGSQCEIALMARDGVWRTQVPKALPTQSLSLTGASRADLAVRCSADSQISINGNPVANVFVDGTPDSAPHPFAVDGTSTWAANRPTYLRDLRNETPSNTETVRMGARTINGSKFELDNPTFSLPADGVQEWSINGGQKHPFHLHIYHVQVIGDCGEFEDGEFYDVIAGNCTVRFDLNPATSCVFKGRTIMHCHILEHEDQGAMGWADVLGGKAPPTFPVNNDVTPYQAKYSLGGSGGNPPVAPNGLTAQAISSSQINISWLDNSIDENGFNIERSEDGSTFSQIDSVGADINSFSDNNLSANTTYYYQVNAFNNDGVSEYSNTTNATTDMGAEPTSVTVGSITISTVNEGKGQRSGRAIVIVEDDQGGLVENAVVSGEFSGSIDEIVSASTATDASGSTTINTTGTASGKVSLTFCVTSITHDNLQDFSAAPGTACSSL